MVVVFWGFWYCPNGWVMTDWNQHNPGINSEFAYDDCLKLYHAIVVFVW